MGAAARLLEVEVDFELPAALSFLLDERARYKVAYGGRGSAKSWSFARALLLQGTEGPERVLCARETQTSIQESVHRLLADQVGELGMGDCYEVLSTSIRGRRRTCADGTSFAFAGLRSDPRAVKGAEGVTKVWVEEAEGVSEDSWNYLIPTIRAEGSEIWVSFNPRLRSDATWKRFVVDPPTDAIIRRVSWRDNPWFPRVLDLERRDLQAKDPALYAHVWEGKCGVMGFTLYPFEDLERARANLRPPESVGVLEQVDQEIRWIARNDGWLEVFERPRAGGDYVVGGDVAKGKVTGDRHSGHVLRRGLAAEQVARIRNVGPMGADEYGRALVLAAKWYGGRATLGIEVTGLGLASCIAARDTGYAHLWMEGGDVGWNTTATSRPLMLAGVGDGLRDNTLVVHSEETHEQLTSFVRTVTGRPEAAPGCHDDEVTGIAIAYQMALRAPVPRPEGQRSGFAKTDFRP